MRLDHKSQHKEHDQLAEPRESVEERKGLAFAGKLAVTNHQTSHIDSQKTIAFHVIGDGKDEDTEGENHDRIETLVGQLHLTHKGNRHLAKSKAHDRTDNNLDNDFLCNLQGTDRGRMGCDNADEGDGEYIRHGIVGT